MNHAVSLTFCALGLVCFLPQTVGANETIGRMFWNQLKSYETDAIRDYRSNNVSKEVLALSDNLWSLSADSFIVSKYEPCRKAARTLSMMVAGSYWSAKANQVAMDWHQYSPSYAVDRGNCLKALRYREKDHQLPWWFGR